MCTNRQNCGPTIEQDKRCAVEPGSANTGGSAMKITRKFTQSGSDPFASVQWVKRSSKISNPDGSIVFQMDDAEVPSSWSQLATDIMVSKYFRKAGVPQVGA